MSSGHRREPPRPSGRPFLFSPTSVLLRGSVTGERPPVVYSLCSVLSPPRPWVLLEYKARLLDSPIRLELLRVCLNSIPSLYNPKRTLPLAGPSPTFYLTSRISFFDYPAVTYLYPSVPTVPVLQLLKVRTATDRDGTSSFNRRSQPSPVPVLWSQFYRHDRSLPCTHLEGISQNPSGRLRPMALKHHRN